MLEKTELEKVAKIFREKNSFAIFGHRGPDLDCVGSQLSMAIFLESIGKKVYVVNYDTPSENFRFLSGLEKFSKIPPAISNVEAVIVVDTNPQLTGFFESHSFLLKNFYPIIEIDHHQKKLSESSVHIHTTEISSTSEIIFYMLENMNFEIDKKIANLLLAGIYGDTSGFLNANVFESTFYSVSKLLEKGAEISSVMENVLNHITEEEISVWSLALSRLRVNEKSKIAHTFLTHSDIEKYKKAGETLSGLSNFLNTIQEADISLVLSEKEEGTIKGSFRSRSNVDVNKLAKLFSPTGGGHIRAAGFSLPGKFVNSGGIWKIQKI